MNANYFAANGLLTIYLLQVMVCTYYRPQTGAGNFS